MCDIVPCYITSKTMSVAGNEIILCDKNDSRSCFLPCAGRYAADVSAQRLIALTFLHAITIFEERQPFVDSYDIVGGSGGERVMESGRTSTTAIGLTSGRGRKFQQSVARARSQPCLVAPAHQRHGPYKGPRSTSLRM